MTNYISKDCFFAVRVSWKKTQLLIKRTSAYKEVSDGSLHNKKISSMSYNYNESLYNEVTQILTPHWFKIIWDDTASKMRLAQVMNVTCTSDRQQNLTYA